MKIARETKAFRRLIWQAVGLGVLAVAAIALTIVEPAHARPSTQAAREQTDLAIVLGREISASSRAVEKVLDDVQAIVENARPTSREEFRRSLGTQAVAASAAREIATAAGADVVSIIADNGDVVNFSRTWPAPNINVAHDDDFVYLSEHDARDDLYRQDPRSARPLATG